MVCFVCVGCILNVYLLHVDCVRHACLVVFVVRVECVLVCFWLCFGCVLNVC